MKEDIAKAFKLVSEYQLKQVDKQGDPYVLHLLRVAYSASDNLSDPDLFVVGLMHDIFEDTLVSPGDLKAMRFPEHIVTAIVELTRRENETYTDYIERLINASDLAVIVKKHDLDDNFGRLDPEMPDYERLYAKYKNALALIDNEYDNRFGAFAE